MTDNIEQRLLTDCCWNYLKIDGDEFIIKILIEDKAPDPFYVVLFSDFIRIWREDLQSAELITRNGILNPNIEVPVARLLQHINQVIINPVNSLNISIKCRKEDEITIVSQSTLSTLPYTWEFHAKKSQRQMLADHITFPLVATLAELNRRQQHLVKIISQKDAQIEDYKAEGLTLPRSGRSEQLFQLTSFAREMDESKEFDDVVESSNKITFGRDLQPLFGMVSNKLIKRHQIKGDVTVKSEMNSVVVDIAETTTKNKLDLDSPSLELERRKQLERKLAEDKLKKLTDKPTKRLKL